MFKRQGHERQDYAAAVRPDREPVSEIRGRDGGEPRPGGTGPCRCPAGDRIERKQKLLQAAVQGRIREVLSVAADPLERALALFEADTTGRYTGSTLETEKRTAVKWVPSKLGDARLKVHDAFAKGQITDDVIVQEIRSPNSTGNALAKELADGWRKAVEFAVKQYE